VRTAVVTVTGGALRVELVSAESEEGKEFNPEECAFEPETSTPNECGPGPGPIIPEMKELAWGAGSFIVFALLMRVFLYPRLRKGMDARYNSIRDGHEAADAARASARSEVAQYEAAVSAAKADAAKVVDAARATLESERQAQINAARASARGQIEAAVADVVTSAVEAATGKRPDGAVVSRAVADAMSAGVSR
jgi:F-type H+-transporting ATPase subunit b